MPAPPGATDLEVYTFTGLTESWKNNIESHENLH